MTYWKLINNRVVSVGVAHNKVPRNCEISEQEYNEIMSVIRSCPNENGKGYRLRTDLTWEEYDLPPVVLSDDDELSTDEVMDILLGGAV